MRKMDRQPSKIAFVIIAYTILTIAIIVSVIPFLMIVAGSFSSNAAIIRDGYSILPREANLDAYRIIFKFPEEVARAYSVSITVTLLGTLGGLVFMSMGGYALQRKELKYRNQISFFVYFTTLFNGGVVPWYMIITGMGMRETLWALILPSMCSSFYILLIRNFMRGLPDSLTESAKIDGAGDFCVFVRIILPLSKPILATVALFLGLGYWNDWYLASLFVKKHDMWPLQYRLYYMLTSELARTQAGGAHFAGRMAPTESLKLANAIIATGPILLLYPFLQKFFVQGITIGAVKG